MRTRITRELARRKHKLPRWLTSFEYVRAEPEVWRISHLLGDDDTYIVGATLPTADHLTAVLYVDQTDSWPMCRPLVEWLLRALPAGGSVPQHRQWTPQEISRLEQDFLASSLAAGMTDDRHREVLRQVLRYGTEHGTGDPLRWSLLRVAALMLEWYPLTVTAGLATMELLPGLLRAFVPYAHERSGIRPDLTDEVIASIEEDEPDYRQLIEAAPEDRAELRAELLAFDIPDDPDWLDDLEGLDGDDNFSGPVIELRDRTES